MLFQCRSPMIELETLMQGVPNFTPRGHGVKIMRPFVYTAEICDCNYCLYYSGRERSPCKIDRCECINVRCETGAVTFTEVLAETLGNIRCNPFIRRFKKYMMGGNIMLFRNDKHRTAFESAAVQVYAKDYAALSAAYLLSADNQLWRAAEKNMADGRFNFEKIKPGVCSEYTYTLLVPPKTSPKAQNT